MDRRVKAIIVLLPLFAAVLIPLMFYGRTGAWICFGIVVIILFLAYWLAKHVPRTPPPDTFDGTTLKIYPPLKKKGKKS